MKIYPLLEELSKAGAKNAVLGLLQAHQNAAADTEPRGDFSLKMSRAVSLLQESVSVQDFLAKAKDL